MLKCTKNRKTINMNSIMIILIILFILYGCEKDNLNLKRVEIIEVPKNIATQVKIPNENNFKATSIVKPLIPPKPPIIGETPKTVHYEIPPKIIKKEPIEYPKYFKDKKFRGVIILEVEVFKSGKVGYVNVKKSFSPGPGHLDEAALKSVKQWIFSPAIANDEPIDCWFEIPIELTNNCEK